jgi:hypothetical protein
LYLYILLYLFQTTIMNLFCPPSHRLQHLFHEV